MTVRLLPGMTAPRLDVPLVGGGRWRLAEQTPQTLTAIFFYRGRHCGVCTTYVPNLEHVRREFEEAGVDMVLISADSEEMARAAKEDWNLSMPVGYGLDIDAMRTWGLFMTPGEPGTPQPAVLSEPGLFCVEPDQKLYFLAIGSAPFGRPQPEEVLDSIKNYLDTGGLRRRGHYVPE